VEVLRFFFKFNRQATLPSLLRRDKRGAGRSVGRKRAVDQGQEFGVPVVLARGASRTVVLRIRPEGHRTKLSVA
jgi:hypothetical protein